MLKSPDLNLYWPHDPIPCSAAVNDSIAQRFSMHLDPQSSTLLHTASLLVSHVAALRLDTTLNITMAAS